MHTSEFYVKDPIAAVVSGKVESSLVSEARAGFMYGAIKHDFIGGLYQRGTGDPVERKLWYPLERLEDPDIQIPPGGVVILHGREDSVVPLRGSERFVTGARQVTLGRSGSGNATITVRDGDHGFDLDSRLDEPWLQDAFRNAVQAWIEKVSIVSIVKRVVIDGNLF